MTLIPQINQDLAVSMKKGATAHIATLRLVKNALQNEQIKLGHELSDDEALKVMQREAKQRRESIEQYRAGGRTDLVDSEQQELAIIETYLPQRLGPKELEQLVDRAIADIGATTEAQMGAVIGAVMQQAHGRADGATVAQLVRQKLR